MGQIKKIRHFIILNTVFPLIVTAAIIIFRKLECGSLLKRKYGNSQKYKELKTDDNNSHILMNIQL